VGQNAFTSKFVHNCSEKIQKKARKSQISSGFSIFEIKPNTSKKARKSQSSSVFFWFFEIIRYHFSVKIRHKLAG